MAVIKGVGRLEDNQDKPIVAGLIAFLSTICRRNLEEVTSWETIDCGNGYGEFRVLFNDNTGVQGSMADGTQGWQVYRFQLTLTGSGNAPTLRSTNEESHELAPMAPSLLLTKRHYNDSIHDGCTQVGYNF